MRLRHTAAASPVSVPNIAELIEISQSDVAALLARLHESTEVDDHASTTPFGASQHGNHILPPPAASRPFGRSTTERPTSRHEEWRRTSVDGRKSMVPCKDGMVGTNLILSPSLGDYGTTSSTDNSPHRARKGTEAASCHNREQSTRMVPSLESASCLADAEAGAPAPISCDSSFCPGTPPRYHRCALPPALSDPDVLQQEAWRWQHSAQERWFHQRTHYHHWDEELLQRGRAHRSHPIAARTAVTMSHTKSLCILLNMDLDTLTTGDEPQCYSRQGLDEGNTIPGSSPGVPPMLMWQSLASIPGNESSVLDQLGTQLEEQYNSLAPRPLQATKSGNPRASDLCQALSDARKSAGEAKVILHYCACGVPPPQFGNLLFARSAAGVPASYGATPYVKLSLDVLHTRVGFPLVFVADCANAGDVMKYLLRIREGLEQQSQLSSRDHQLTSSRNMAFSMMQEMEDGSRGAGTRGDSHTADGLTIPLPVNDFYFIGASGDGEGRTPSLAPSHPQLPSDILTCCLTTPLRMVLLWFLVNRADLSDLHPVVLSLIPGALHDKKTPMGQLQWYFQSIVECIAWSSLPLAQFSRLFREDIYVAPLYRGFLLAQRIVVGGLGGVLSVYPPMPPTHTHPMWETFDNIVERCCVALMKALRPAPPTVLSVLDFHEWLDIRMVTWRYHRHGLWASGSAGGSCSILSTAGAGKNFSSTTTGEYSSILPMMDESKVRVPNFFYEELRGVEAFVDCITEQSFVLPWTSTAHGTPKKNARRNGNGADRRLGSSSPLRWVEDSSSRSGGVVPGLGNDSTFQRPSRRPNRPEEFIGNPNAVEPKTVSFRASKPVFPFCDRMPIILQSLLVMAHREKGTELLCRFVDVGPPAIMQCAEANIYRVVLDRYWSRPDLRYLLPSTLFIYTKSCFADATLIGTSQQRETAIKVCGEVLQCPCPVGSAAAATEAGAGATAGAWQSEVLGLYSTPEGQRLLAASLLVMLVAQSDEARDACHRYGIFQVCCQLLAERAQRTPLLPRDAIPLGLQQDPNSIPVCAEQADISLQQSIDVRTCLVLVSLFVCLLHSWNLPAAGEVVDGGMGESDGLSRLEPLDGTVQELPSTNRFVLNECLLLSVESLRRLAYSTVPSLRGAALRGLSIVLASPAPDYAMQERYAHQILRRLDRRGMPMCEGNMDLRLNVQGAGYHTYKWLLDQVKREMTVGEIGDAVAQDMYKWSVAQTRKRRPQDGMSTNEAADSVAEGEAAMGHRHVDAAGGGGLPAVLRDGSPVFQPPGGRPPGIMCGRPERSIPGSSKKGVPFSLAQSSRQYSFPPRSRTGSTVVATSAAVGLDVDEPLDYIAGIGQLIRVCIEHTQDCCPYISSQARRVVLEEFGFLRLPNHGGKISESARSSFSGATTMGHQTHYQSLEDGRHGNDAGDYRRILRQFFPNLPGSTTIGITDPWKGRDRTKSCFFVGSDAPDGANDAEGEVATDGAGWMVPRGVLNTQDRVAVTAFGHAIVSYLGDVLLVKPDDYDPRHLFNLDKEEALYWYLQRAGAGLQINTVVERRCLLSDGARTRTGLAPPHLRGAASDEALDSCTRPQEAPFAPLCEGTHQVNLGAKAFRAVNPALPSQGLSFHPTEPHLVSFTDGNVLRVWQIVDRGCGPSLQLGACYCVSDVLARPQATEQPQHHVRYAYLLESGETTQESLLRNRCNEATDPVDGDGGDLSTLKRSPSPKGSLTVTDRVSNCIVGLHYVDAAHDTLLCVIRRAGSVELVSGYTDVHKVRRCTTFESSLDDLLRKNGYVPSSCYQPQNQMLHLSGVDGCVESWDLGAEHLTTKKTISLKGVPQTIDALGCSYASPFLFAAGAGPLFLFDVRETSHRSSFLATQSIFGCVGSTTAPEAMDTRVQYVSFSRRYPSLLLSSYRNGVVVGWDQRMNRQPLLRFSTASAATPEQLAFMEVHSCSRSLLTVSSNGSSSVNVTEFLPAEGSVIGPSGSRAAGTATLRLSLPEGSRVGALALHPFQPLLAVSTSHGVGVYQRGEGDGFFLEQMR